MADLDAYATKLKERMRRGEVEIPRGSFLLLRDAGDRVEVQFHTKKGNPDWPSFDRAVEGMGFSKIV